MVGGGVSHRSRCPPGHRHDPGRARPGGARGGAGRTGLRHPARPQGDLVIDGPAGRCDPAWTIRARPSASPPRPTDPHSTSATGAGARWCGAIPGPARPRPGRAGPRSAGLVLDRTGARLYVADREHRRVVAIDTAGMRVSGTAATGDGAVRRGAGPRRRAALRGERAQQRPHRHRRPDARPHRHHRAGRGDAYGVAVTVDGRTVVVSRQHAGSVALVSADRLAPDGEVRGRPLPRGCAGPRGRPRRRRQLVSGDLPSSIRARAGNWRGCPWRTAPAASRSPSDESGSAAGRGAIWDPPLSSSWCWRRAATSRPGRKPATSSCRHRRPRRDDGARSDWLTRTTAPIPPAGSLPAPRADVAAGDAPPWRQPAGGPDAGRPHFIEDPRIDRQPHGAGGRP